MQKRSRPAHLGMKFAIGNLEVVKGLISFPDIGHLKISTLNQLKV